MIEVVAIPNTPISHLVQCSECWAIIHISRRAEHEAAMHSRPTVTEQNWDGTVVATYPDDWRDPVIADKNTCYHREGTDEPPH